MTTFSAAVTSGFMNMFDFRTRAARAEYWWFQVIVIAAFLPVTVDTFYDGFFYIVEPVLYTYTFAVFTVLICLISLTVRRLHDLNMSGWWYLLIFVPYVGSLILFVLMLLRGTDGPNRFGRPRIPMRNPDTVEIRQTDAKIRAIEEHLNKLLTDQETVEKFCDAYEGKLFQDCWDIMSAAGVGDDETYSFMRAMRENGYVPELILSRRQSAD